jgi:hypothetical protein
MNNGLKSSDVQVENTEKVDNKQSSPSLHSSQPNIPFWANDPNILFQPSYIFELFPMDSMTYEQKLNAVTRTIIILTLFGFFISRSFQIVTVSIVTIAAIYVMYYYHNKERKKIESKKIVEEIKEGFANPATDYLNNNNMPVDPNIFMPPNSANPFSNVLVTDYEFNPNKKPAEPAYVKSTNDKILSSAKKLVDEANPNHPNISDKLFRDLGDELEFEQSLRQFTSNPATTIPNDQGAFAEFCYGSMISCKEGNLFACARNLSHYTNY